MRPPQLGKVKNIPGGSVERERFKGGVRRESFPLSEGPEVPTAQSGGISFRVRLFRNAAYDIADF